MSRFCPVARRRQLVGNNVSHANNRTKRIFVPNMQIFSFLSKTLKQTVRLRLCVRGMRTIENAGGIDAYLEKEKRTKLDPTLLPLKRSFEKAKKHAA